MNFTKVQAITLMQRGAKMTHIYFSKGEWVTTKDDNEILMENGIICDSNKFWNSHTISEFDMGWSIFHPENLTMNDILIIIGIEDFNKMILDEMHPYSDLGELLGQADEEDIMYYTDPENGGYYAWKLLLHGITEENYPWEELRGIYARLRKHLSENLIIPIS